MNLGFNSNLQLRDTVYHVQTEDRGLQHPYIDTVVLSQGQVLHRRSTSYEDLLAGGAVDEATLRTRVEQQHQDVLAALQAGSLPLHSSAHGQANAVDLKLNNAQSLLAGGQASVELEVSSRGDGKPIEGAEVVIAIEGEAGESLKFSAKTDALGRARVEFPLPEFANTEAATLLIEAHTAQGQSHLRYRLKPKGRGTVPPTQ